MNRILGFMLIWLLGAVLFLFATWSPDSSGFEGDNIFRIPLSSNPPTLDPVKIKDVTSDSVARKIYNTLLHFDRDLKLIPDLAEAVPEWDETEYSYTFKLRSGIFFHHGREVTASDIKYSWERLLDPAVSSRGTILAAVKGARDKYAGIGTSTPGLVVVDERTFKVILEGPSPTFLLQIAMINAAIIPEEKVLEAQQAGREFSSLPVGTGPFMLTVWAPERYLYFKRFDLYIFGRPELDGIAYEIVKEPSLRLLRFMKGEFHVCDIPFGKLKGLQEKHPQLLVENATLRTNYLGFTMNKPLEGGKFEPAEPLGKNPKLRRAISHALNREYICNVTLEGRGYPAASILPNGMNGHDPELKGTWYDPVLAVQLLAEAGYPQGKGLRPLELFYRNAADAKQIAVVIQSDLKAIGIDLELRELEWATYLKRLSVNPPDMFYLGWIADYPDPENFLYWLFHSGQWGDPGNKTRYANPEVDRMVEVAGKSMNRVERLRIYNRVERMLMDDAPWAPLFYMRNKILLQNRIEGVRGNLTPLDVGHELSHIDFSKVRIGRVP